MRRAALVFAVLTVAMTWPLARHLSTNASPHQDVYFNMWRRWFAHALSSSPMHLFDGNIFYPERSTLALSDAMPLEGLIAAPFFAVGLKPVLVNNLMTLLPIAASGLAMFALARHLTGSRGAGAIAGIAFAYAPYRYDHLMHMELQWTMWMPLAFLALHRTLNTGRWIDGLALGACVALQMLSCIYYGIFLATLITPAVLFLVWRDRGVPVKALAGPLVAGGVLAIAISAAYAVPFVRQHDRVGDRSVADVDTFSATPASYLSVPPENQLYGNPGRPGHPERRLFPGTIVVLLAVVALLLRAPSRRAVAYLLILLVAFEASLGYSGHLYPLLARTAPAYRSLRAMGRLGIFVVFALSVLAAYGYAALVAARGVRVRRVVFGVLAAGLLFEYRTDVALAAFPNDAPPVYVMLARQPRGVLAEFPVPRLDMLPGHDADYTYMSTFHWFPLVNGYSGNYPASYVARLERLRGFPDETSIRQLHRDGVRYVIVHGAFYSGTEMDEIHSRLETARIVELGAFDAADGPARLYVVH